MELDDNNKINLRIQNYKMFEYLSTNYEKRCTNQVNNLRIHELKQGEYQQSKLDEKERKICSMSIWKPMNQTSTNVTYVIIATATFTDRNCTKLLTSTKPPPIKFLEDSLLIYTQVKYYCKLPVDTFFQTHRAKCTMHSR